MKALYMVTWILVIIGALNWGLVGIGMFVGGNWNVINILIGSWSPQLEWVIYVLVGLSGVWGLIKHRGNYNMGGSGAAM